MNASGFRNTTPRDDVKLLNKLLLAQGQVCFYCGRHISLRKFFSSLRYGTVDHFIPVSLGGRDNVSNVVLACGRCNRRKGGRFPTLPELVRWNALAQVWPHIQPLDLEVHSPRKLCVFCGALIPIDRRLMILKSNNETKVCSSVCSAEKKKKRREVKH
jgi:hypothetical protein